MSNETKNKIIKENWLSHFNLIGIPKINDYTYKIDEKSESSNWRYNSMNIGIDCGEKYGTVYCELMGGFNESQPGVIYAHGKDDDGNDDFQQQIQVDWEDRFDENILETIGALSFITVGLEKTDKGKTFYKKFLSGYDAIAYIKEHLEENMVLNIKGNIHYSTYNGNTQTRKNITSIVLSKKSDPKDFIANFTQSILIDKNSTALKADFIDKDKGVIYVNSRVLDYVKEINGVEIKGQYPFEKQFEFAMDFADEARCKKIIDKLFKVKKNISQINFEGIFVEGGATVTATVDDIPEEIKDLIDGGVYTLEEALAKCSASGNREQRMILTKPVIRLVGDDAIPTLQIFAEKYTDDDLVLDLSDKETETDDVEEADETITSSDATDWLDSL